MVQSLEGRPAPYTYVMRHPRSVPGCRLVDQVQQVDLINGGLGCPLCPAEGILPGIQLPVVEVVVEVVVVDVGDCSHY
jgi:hypothetical protein